MKAMFVRILVFLLSLGLLSCQGHSSSPDKSFDVSVQEPQLTGLKVVFDEAHKNHHQISRTYSPFAALVTHDGCKVTANDGSITASKLAGADIYVIATAASQEEPGDQAAFSETETGVLEEWVQNGGSALIITEHYPFGLAMKSLLEKFGVEVHNGYTEDSVLNNPLVADALLFEKSKGNLNRSHPVTRDIERVNTFTGSSVRGDSTWTDLLILSSSAQNYNVDVTVSREGGDVSVGVTYSDFYPASGFSQGICKQYGKGKIAVLAESAMVTAQFDKHGNKFGMNVPGCDNKQFTLNLIRWLANPNPSLNFNHQ